MSSWRENGTIRSAAIIVGAFLLVCMVALLAWFLPLGNVTYSGLSDPAAAVSPILAATSTGPAPFVVTHVPIPDAVKAIYITACTASEKMLRAKPMQLIEDTELNAIMIDLKDYTGTISYSDTEIETPPRVAGVRSGCRITDLKEFIGELHDRGIYVIARITVFQDPLYAEAHPDLAVKSLSRPGQVWRDRNGLAFIEVGARPYWEHIVKIGREAYEIGFDELNFDYIRFPSDGNMRDTHYTWSEGKSRREALTEFFAYLRDELGGLGAPLSADLFGLTTSAADDLGIGQYLEDALPYFDYIAPMVYPSHFARGYNGIANPAAEPYEIIKQSMSRAVERTLAASSTPAQLRPWLQDFNLGAVYTPAMVRAQIQATYDSGLTSWMLWNAASSYQKEALLSSDASVSSPLSTSTDPIR